MKLAGKVAILVSVFLLGEVGLVTDFFDRVSLDLVYSFRITDHILEFTHCRFVRVKGLASNRLTI